MAAFDGFSTENLVPLPAEFFTNVLPCITSAAEMKVTLHLFWLVSRQRGRAKRVSWETLLADATLTQGFHTLSPLRPPTEVLEEGLRCAVERGTLLHVVSAEAGRAVNWYLVNTNANRAWVERHGGTKLEPVEPAPPPPPTIFTLYEHNIGVLTPMLVEELREAGTKYPALWLEEAVRAAVEANIRNWRYIRRILERWEADGKETPTHRSEPAFDLRKYTSGKYAAFFGRTDNE